MEDIQLFSMDDKFTNNLEEKIYFGDTNDLINVRNQLNLFFKELIKRKRNEPIEGGLQASVVVYKDRAAAKVNENDGKGVHIASNINLTKFLFGDNNYLTEKGIRYFGLYTNELGKFTKEAIEVRILDGQDSLMLAIHSYNEIESLFKLKVLKMIIDICKIIKDKNIYKEIEVGFSTPNISIDFEDFSETRYQTFLNFINNESKKIG